MPFRHRPAVNSLPLQAKALKKQTETINITADKPLYTYQIDEMNRLILMNSDHAIDQSQTWHEIKRQLELQEKWLGQIVH